MDKGSRGINFLRKLALMLVLALTLQSAFFDCQDVEAATKNTVKAKKTVIAPNKANTIQVTKAKKNYKLTVKVLGTAKKYVTVKYGKTVLVKNGNTRKKGKNKVIAKKTKFNLTVTATKDALKKNYKIQLVYTKGTKKVTTKPVTVKVAVTKVKLNKTSAELKVGGTVTLKATVNPSNATNKTVTWSSSNSKIATVSKGKVTAKGKGTATITATADGKKATCKVTVTAKDVAVTEVKLDRSECTLKEGDTTELKATVSPANAINKTVTWQSSDESIAKVDSNGKVTAISAGKAIITATAGGKSAACTVTVTKASDNTNPNYDVVIYNVESIKLIPNKLELEVDDTATLEATIIPSYATNRNITWESSDITVAKVSTGGAVTAIAPGTATITATADGKSATCEVNVKAKNISVESIKLNEKSLEILVEGKSLLTATVTPENATDKRVTWTSSDTDVATVSTSGEVTAIAVGTATITAKAGDKDASCTVTVKPIPVTGITLSSNDLTIIEGESETHSLNLKVGDEGTLIATVLPENATYKTVTWSSSDENVVMVSGGAITAKVVGTATVTAQAGDKSASCTVTVNPIAVTGITLNKTTLSFIVGGSETLSATVTPENATDKSVTWTSTDTAVATVSASGEVTAISVGEATITAQAGEKSASCTVAVKAQEPEITQNLPSLIVINGDYMAESVDGVAIPEPEPSEEDNSYKLEIEAKVSDGGTLSYQWYLATNETENGGVIEDQTTYFYGINNLSDMNFESNVFEPVYIYVVVTNTNGGDVKQKVSNRTKIEMVQQTEGYIG